MNFHQHRPTEPLNKYVDVLMYYTDWIPDHSIERLVPTGNAFIIFELDGFVRKVFDNKTLAKKNTYSKVWVSGLHKNYLSISAHEQSAMFVVQFNATGAYPFLHTPMENLAEEVVDATTVLGDDILKLRDDLLSSNSTEKKFACVEKWLIRRLKPELAAPKGLQNIVGQLQQAPVANMSDIISNFSHSQKHLIDLFKKHIGLTPKYYQRILRFNELLQRIQKKEKISWTEIAYSCGYSDQSHFIKEFKHFSGFNPKEFIDNAYNKQDNFFPLDRKG